MLSKEQTADMGYLRRVLGVALRDKVYMFGFRKARCQAKFLTCEISDFTPCTHTQTDILHSKYADKTDY